MSINAYGVTQEEDPANQLQLAVKLFRSLETNAVEFASLSKILSPEGGFA